MCSDRCGDRWVECSLRSSASVRSGASSCRALGTVETREPRTWASIHQTCGSRRGGWGNTYRSQTILPPRGRDPARIVSEQPATSSRFEECGDDDAALDLVSARRGAAHMGILFRCRQYLLLRSTAAIRRRCSLSSACLRRRGSSAVAHRISALRPRTGGACPALVRSLVDDSHRCSCPYGDWVSHLCCVRAVRGISFFRILSKISFLSSGTWRLPGFRGVSSSTGQGQMACSFSVQQAPSWEACTGWPADPWQRSSALAKKVLSASAARLTVLRTREWRRTMSRKMPRLVVGRHPARTAAWPMDIKRTPAGRAF